MRVNMGREGRTSSSLSANGGTMLGSLILANGPSQPLEAATKYYVDTAFANLNANNIVDGVLPISSLPGFTGDATSNQGSNTITLANLGVNPGSYAKVIVDSKGRVTGNDVLSSSDLPVVNWSKIQNEPTTVEDYGITDALTTAGGTLTGNLSVGAPVQSLSAVNKQYVDSALSGNSAVVGDIIRKPYADTPIGFLRCNGGLVDKITYSDLYAVIGDNFTMNTTPGSGKPWQQQYQINTIQSVDINSWTTGTALPSILGMSQVVVTKNRVYLLGGRNGTAYLSTVYTAPINSDGTLGTWTTGTSLPVGLGYSQVIVTKNRVYLLGGRNSTSYISTVYTAPINSDGTLGTWTTDNSLPGSLGVTQAVVTKNRVYLLGGYDDTTYLSIVYTAVINTDGTLGTWSTGTSLPGSLALSQAIITKNRVYLVGGYDGTATVATVYTAVINTDGTLGTWSTGTSLPGQLAESQAIVTKNRVYLLGGRNGSGWVSTVYTAAINADGTLGTWTTGTSLPGSLSNSQAIVTNNRIYLLGGYISGSYVATVYTAIMYGGKNDYSPYYSSGSANTLMPGSGKPWEQQYQFNTVDNFDPSVWTPDTSLPAALSRTSIVVTKNQVYLLGGTTLSGATSTVYVANINSDGSLGAWATGTSLPTPVTASTAIVTKNRVYLLGGQNTTSPTNIVYTAPIDSSGTIGAWGTGISLPVTCTYCSAVVVSNYAYLFPGYVSGGASTAVYKAYIDTDGTIGEWSSAASLPGSGGVSQIAVTKNKIYAVGRYALSAPSSAVYSTSVDSNGDLTSWVTEATSLPIAHGNAGVFVTGNKIYIFAGWTTGDVLTSAVEIGTLASDGSIIGWSTGTSLPVASNGKLFSTNSRLYYLGLHTSNAQSSVYYANFSGGLNDYSAYSDGTYSVAQIPNYMMPGSGKPWEQQYQINTTQINEPSSWSYSPLNFSPSSVQFSQVIVTKNRVYLLGGYTAAVASDIIYSCSINADGTLGTWSNVGNLPVAAYGAQAIVIKNNVYFFYSSNVYKASINADGTIGTWSNMYSLPGPKGYAKAFVTKNYVYIVAGTSAAAYYALINSDGSLGSWYTSVFNPGAIQNAYLFVTKNRVYICGGTSGTIVKSAIISDNGLVGTWTVETSLPESMSSGAVFATKNRVYLFSGIVNLGYNSNKYYYANIGADGSISTWTLGTVTFNTMLYSIAFATKNHIYIIGEGLATATITDSLSDYSPYYDGTIVPVSSGVDETTLFALPDFSAKEKNGVNIYIKY